MLHTGHVFFASFLPFLSCIVWIEFSLLISKSNTILLTVTAIVLCPSPVPVYVLGVSVPSHQPLLSPPSPCWPLGCAEEGRELCPLLLCSELDHPGGDSSAQWECDLNDL